jgi:DNA-directed RNA polymerase specialized sigma24 family protein
VGGDVIAPRQRSGEQSDSLMLREFEQFYRDHHAKVRRFAWVRCTDRELADEAANEAFFTAWVKWAEVRAHAKPLAWVFVTTNNKLSEARRRGAGGRYLLLDVWPDTDSVEPNQIVIETTMVVDQVLAFLAPVERQAVLLSSWGYSEREAAAILGITLHTYKTYKRDARRKARDARAQLGLDEGGWR